MQYGPIQYIAANGCTAAERQTGRGLVDVRRRIMLPGRISTEDARAGWRGSWELEGLVCELFIARDSRARVPPDSSRRMANRSVKTKTEAVHTDPCSSPRLYM